MSQELMLKPSETQASALVVLAVTRIVETTDKQLQAELLNGFEQLLERLLVSTTGPLEQLVAEEIGLCWTELQKLRTTHARLESTLRPAQQTWWAAAISAAQLRLFRAVEQLARMRRLTLPSKSEPGEAAGAISL